MMKKILLFVLVLSASICFNQANAQWCGNVNSIFPNPATPPGFPDPNTLPCAVQGTPYRDTINFQMLSGINFQGNQTIDSVTVDTIWNLPCGLCWSMNRANKTYAAYELGLIYITGTTHDAVGQYNLRLQVTAYINHNPTGVYIQSPNEVDAAGIKMWVRVAASAGNCALVDTSVNGVNQVAVSSCPNGINEVAANVQSISISPNPISSTSVLSFVAEKNASYAVKVTDVTGKVISVKEVQANPGVNTTSIERGNLSAGIYLLSLSDGVSSVTRKFSIVE